MTTSTSRPASAKFFAIFLVMLAMGGAYGAWAVPHNIEQERAVNFQAVSAERAAFWRSYVDATTTDADSQRVAYIARRVQSCSPIAGSSTLDQTRREFIHAETSCMTMLRNEVEARTTKNSYDRMVVLVNWVANTTS